MRASLKLFRQFFLLNSLVAGGPLALIVGIGLFTLGHLPRLALFGAGVAFLFGVCIALGVSAGFVLMQAWAVRRLGVAVSAETLSVRQRANLTLPMDQRSAFELATREVQALPGAVIVRSNAMAGEVEAIIDPQGLTSGANSVTIKIERAGSGLSGVLIDSRPRSERIMFDFGANLRQVLTLCGRLQPVG